MSAEARRAIYLDSSALVKLVVQEAESAALRRYLRARPLRVSNGLARVEVVRAVRPQGDSARIRARDVLAGIRMLALDEPLLKAAASLDAGPLRTLDALHIAAALEFGDSLESLVTYDLRMATAAESLGCRVAAPA